MVTGNYGLSGESLFVVSLLCVCGSYHIAGSMGVFYAREPYLNVDSSHVTRFLGLAQVGNKNKQVCSSIIPVRRAWYLIIFVYRFCFLLFGLERSAIAFVLILLTV